jgi:hypothetical protein
MAETIGDASDIYDEMHRAQGWHVPDQAEIQAWWDDPNRGDPPARRTPSPESQAETVWYPPDMQYPPEWAEDGLHGAEGDS